MRELHCYSDGDWRFSAFKARYKSNGNLLEEVYQFSKKDRYGRAFGVTIKDCKGRLPHFLYLLDELVPIEDRNLVHDWYRLLWQFYFFEFPELLIEATKYQVFIDKYDGEGGYPYKPCKGYQHGKKVAQSAAIASIVYSFTHEKPYQYHPWIQEHWDKLLLYYIGVKLEEIA